MNGGWVGFDLDGTLAVYDGWKGVEHVGAPVPPMVAIARDFLAAGVPIRIVTARVSVPEQADAARAAIEAWCLEHLGVVVPVTCTKDFQMLVLYDDRAISVQKNTGRCLGFTFYRDVVDP
jgi:hypothetical protein